MRFYSAAVFNFLHWNKWYVPTKGAKPTKKRAKMSETISYNIHGLPTYIYLVITLCSFCCNLFALFIISRVYLRDRDNISLRILINLITSGLLLSLTGFINTTGTMFMDPTNLSREPIHNVYCRTMIFLQNIFYVEIFITLTAISLERWCVVCRPLQAKHMITEHKLHVFLLGSWLLSICINLPLPLYISGVEQVFVTSLNRHELTCAEVRHLDTFWWKLISMGIFVVVFAVPVFVMSVMYGKIVRDLVCQSRPGLDTKAPNKFMEQRHRAAKASLLISAQFTLCYGPFSVYVICLTMGGKELRDDVINFVLGSIIPMMGVILNPVLFCYALESFRVEIWSLFSCRWCQTTISSSKSGFYDIQKSHIPGAHV